MSGYKNFAVAGAGNIGKFIVEALLEKKAVGVISSISLLTRSSGGHEDLVAKGVKLVTVDYTSPSSIQSALSNVDVVISTLAGAALGLQEGFATSAKAAGVKLFVPSEFGNNTEGATEGIFGIKKNLQNKLKNDLKLPYALFYTGAFTDLLLAPGFSVALGFDFAKGVLTVPGSGTADLSWTTRPDIARYLAYVLTALPKEKIEWRIFRIEGDRASFNKVAEDWKTQSGKNVTISHRPISDFEAALAKNPNDIISILVLEWEAGKGVVGKPDEVTNSEFVEWKPKKVIDVLAETYGH